MQHKCAMFLKLRPCVKSRIFKSTLTPQKSHEMIVDINRDSRSVDDFRLDVVDKKDRIFIIADCPGFENLQILYGHKTQKLVFIGSKISNERRRFVNKIRAPEADSILFGESYVRNPYDQVKKVILNERKVGTHRRIVQLPDSALLSEKTIRAFQNKDHGTVNIEITKNTEMVPST